MSANPAKSKPEISGTAVGESIGGVTYPIVEEETTKGPGITRFTYWFFWPYDVSHGDGKADYEPATPIFRSSGGTDLLDSGAARVHYALARYTNLVKRLYPQVYFTSHGHTPVFHVRVPIRDIRVERKGDVADGARWVWLMAGHRAGERLGWKGTRSYKLAGGSGPPIGSRAREAPYF
ncbi:MAG: hypothetical protein LYZ66_01750 [Nitrososphaerales archaeon]|nr:hypothetical protein [Nitrososphaerales archaeon]